MMRKLIFTILILIIGTCHAYSQQDIIDSLVMELDKVEGEDRIRLLARLSYMNLDISIEESEKYSEQLREYALDIGYARGEALANNIEGRIYTLKGNYRKALTYFNYTLEYFTSVADTMAISRTLNNLAICHHELGEYDNAISIYRQSLEIAQMQEDTENICLTLINMGVIYSEWDKIETALENYRASLKLAEAIRNDKYTAINLLNIGVQLRRMKSYDSALYYMEKSLEIRNKTNDEQGVFTILINKGTVYREMGMPENAISQFELALEKSKILNNSNDFAEASLHLGKTHLEAGNLSAAKSNLISALESAQQSDDQKLIQEGYKALSDYYKVAGNYQSALEYYEAYTQIKDSIFNRESRKDLAEMQTLYEMDKKERELENQNLKNEQLKLRFYLTILGVLLLIVIAWLLFNRYKLRQKHFRIELERKNIEIEQRLLRTQMNPHFIFNSLNSINSFVIDNNVDAAQSFLSKFAKLMRSILENSRMEMVSVDEELIALQLNMELEQLRFDYKFDFSIKVDERVETEFTFIPPMLIQPFIENAILHGMATLERKGMITLKIMPENGLFLCEVIDNGIGREASAKFKKVAAGKSRKSLGMQVTRERLEMLAVKHKNPDIGFAIIDLEDRHGKSSGTKVEIRIPFEEE